MTTRVLFLQSQAFFGADSTIHALLMRHFDRRSIEVHVACTKEEPANPLVSAARHLRATPDVRFRPTNFGPSLFGVHGRRKFQRMAELPVLPLSLLSLAAYIRRHDIDVIHGTEKPRDALYGVLLGKMTGAKSVVHMHISYGDWQRGAVKWALRNADAIVGVSRFTARSIVDAGFPAERIFAVPNSLDLTSSRWDPDLDGRAVRRSLGIPDDAPVVGITARLYKWKGLDDLLDALTIVKRVVPQVRLVIVGEDDPRAHPGGSSYRAELEAKARRLDLAENVIFTGFRTDIPQLVAMFDVCAVPSREEPFGMVFLEAMAMKKPTVAWASGGAPEVIAHQQTGLLVEPGNIVQLAEAIIGLLRDPDQRRRFGKAGRQRVERDFNPQRMCHDIAAVYAVTLGAPRTAAGANLLLEQG